MRRRHLSRHDKVAQPMRHDGAVQASTIKIGRSCSTGAALFPDPAAPLAGLYQDEVGEQRATLHILCHRCGADRLALPDEAAGRRCGAAADMSALPVGRWRPIRTLPAADIPTSRTASRIPPPGKADRPWSRPHYSKDSALWASRSFRRESFRRGWRQRRPGFRTDGTFEIACFGSAAIQTTDTSLCFNSDNSGHKFVTF